MPSIHRTIWNKFHVHRRDNPPFYCWHGGREELAELFKDLGYKTGAEVGVYCGHYSKVLLEKNPDLKLYCIDPWAPYFYYSQTHQEKQDRCFQKAEKNLAGLNKEFVKKTSMEAVKDFADGSLDFVYIDALHDFDNIMLDLIHWVPKVRSGGIVSGHDYMVGYLVGVIQAVDVYTRIHKVDMYYVTGKEREPSFFWVKE